MFATAQTRRGEAVTIVGEQHMSDLITIPCECPRCGEVAAFPYRVATDFAKLDCIHVDIKCRECSNEWHLERIVPSLAPARSMSPGRG
jgi:hypothetical protein